MKNLYKFFGILIAYSRLLIACEFLFDVVSTKSTSSPVLLDESLKPELLEIHQIHFVK